MLLESSTPAGCHHAKRSLLVRISAPTTVGRRISTDAISWSRSSFDNRCTATVRQISLAKQKTLMTRSRRIKIRGCCPSSGLGR
ncbi:hypothetical protein M404DRAFT_650261 [Pisolithus tinctorius Marx 270]|uniref:Uncharacterized protein n=1 Tax=Pisolithus tinctorius Marx 270 TaxID=870435 RepID=A0A0C3P4W8_PISTI|nr:hypothetical protein M404DRAFT_650261 [Pisolithus tinctorius Marx 270]